MEKHRKKINVDTWRSYGLAPIPDKNKKVFAYDILQRFISGNMSVEQFKIELLRSRDLRNMARDYMYQYMQERNRLISICDKFFLVTEQMYYPHNMNQF